nr:MAG TPA: hypothetical protein [Caudoviricetes sp.]
MRSDSFCCEERRERPIETKIGAESSKFLQEEKTGGKHYGTF